MANKLVDATQLDADLTSVADAIREKGGTSEELTFPGGFVDAIGNISGGGGSIGDGNNLLANSDFSQNSTGVTSWRNTGSSQNAAIDFWTITYADLSVNQDGSVRLSRNGGANAYLMQLITQQSLQPLVGKSCKIIAVINGTTYTSIGALSDSGDSIQTNTPYGTIRVYKYSSGLYAITVDIRNSQAEYIDVSGMAFGLEDDLIYPPSLTTKTITENGTYVAKDDGACGYSEVVVNVPGGGLIEEYDFTGSNPKIGKIRGIIATSWNITFSSNGALFGQTSSYITFPRPIGFNGMTVEIEIGNMNLTSGSHRRFVMGNIDTGFIYRNGIKWSFYAGSSSGGGWTEDTTETSGSFFANSTLKIHIDNNGYWHIYKNGVLWWEPEKALSLNSSGTVFQIGSTSGQSINNCEIKSIKFY